MSTGTALTRLAAAAGVAVSYTAAGATVTPPDGTLRAVLTALGHPCHDEDDARRSLGRLRTRPWARPIDPIAIHWRDDRQPTRVTFSAGDPERCELSLTLEDGSARDLPTAVWGGTRRLDGEMRRRATVELPADLPLGYHRLTITDRGRTAACTVIVAPPTCPHPGSRRRWGWMLQAYALRSARSWGQGEFPDLGGLAAWSAAQGADFVLINPVHAVAPMLPQQASPYSPTSRRFANPCYLHLPALPEFDLLPAGEQQELRSLSPDLGPHTDRIDRDRIWERKRAVLQRLFEAMGPERRRELARYRQERGVALERFARFCALAEVHGLPFGDWPEPLRDPRMPEVDRWAGDHADRIALHAWLQLLCDEQLAAAQERARRAGMSIGIVHDLAVGVDPAGADVWALPDEFARGMSVGAPPDAFNQKGQDWAQPPPLPAAQRANAYRTLRDVLRASLRTAGGLRIDHILGLSRLFWIPDGADPGDGTYVRYPVEEQFAVLALEAHRAGPMGLQREDRELLVQGVPH
ncbi:MAG TPA: 4-alpha-glucanotransferase, partial [Euzebyales bacterium]|nr:4-alpha-glucanotransferase [Euzebyales bacterium]